MKKKLSLSGGVLLVLALAFGGLSAAHADVKIGFTATLSGPVAAPEAVYCSNLT